MSPRHFSNYAKEDPKGYAAFSDSMWNGFVSVTHAIGLSKFFTFTPDFVQGPKAASLEQKSQGPEEESNHSSLYK